MKKRETFIQVLCNCDDQVSVSDILNDVCPYWVKREVVRRFNQRVELYNNNKIEWSDEAMEDCECIPCFKGEDDE